ncbi:hypothetical protein V2J09_018920 [Rumex salicifolius]
MMSMTPDVSKKTGVGVTPSPYPFLTPRPERRRADLRASGFDWNPNNRQDKDKDREVNVQVILRCRPLSDDEQKLNISRAVTCNEQKREVITSQSIGNKQLDKVFTFDKVFGPKSQQRSIYDQAISPIVSEVLDGFNCTVFAYGQTGTGKTYTMEGGMRSKNGDLPIEAGVIPRAIRQIFDTLEAQGADYSIKVTFLELYNEEISDLLAAEDNSRFPDEKQKKSVSLMEDGKGCVVVRGLEEEVVYSANDIYNLLERGAAKRRTADTLLNKRSSRSHAVFTITVHVKEAVIGEEELIKCGKLNLVDLAGSENILRSGVREGRAREAGEINKSLLTLGRVINALVEHSVHIPYRDSKLTRLLRDSLGGKTKTCIIATISPSAHCLEETLSTLDYAHRAKNIKNKPEANQKMSKTMLLKELYLEIDRMKQDVRAAREKNGVYVPHERFTQEEAEKKARIERIEQLEADLSQSEKEVEKYRELYLSEQERKLDLEAELKDSKRELENTKKALQTLEEKYKQTILQLKEKDFIISKLLHSENSLIERAKELRSNLENASDNIDTLHVKIDQKAKMEAENHEMVLTFGSQLDQSLRELHQTILGSVTGQRDRIRCIEEQMSSFLACKHDATANLESKINTMTEKYASGVQALRELASTLQRKASTDLEQITFSISSQKMSIENFLDSAVFEANEVINSIQNSISMQKQLLAFSAQQQQEGLQRTLASAQLISEATNSFFNDLCSHASKVMFKINENQTRNHQCRSDFEKMFKEQAAEEERQATEKIAAILATLTAKKTAIVSDAMRNIRDMETQANKTFQQELSHIQQVSSVARVELCGHFEKVESHFLEDSHLLTHVKSTMNEHLEDSQLVDYSRQQLDRTHDSVNNIHDREFSEIQSIAKRNTGDNKTIFDNSLAESVSKDEEFNSSTSALLTAIKDSFSVDSFTKNEVDSLASVCFDQLTSIQNKHNESVSSITNQAQQCITKDYLVDRQETPVRRVMRVPTLESIEGMRTPAFEGDLVGHRDSSENITKYGKIQQVAENLMSPNRAPFVDPDGSTLHR